MSSKKYNVTTDSVIGWAKSEVEHVSRIAAVEDPDIQYSYAQSTVNGMLHLRDALFQLVNDPKYADRKDELLMIHDKIVLLVKQLIKQYKVNLDEIKAFNTRKVLGSLNYLKGGSKTRKNRRV
jgi:hypothetical protein